MTALEKALQDLQQEHDNISMVTYDLDLDVTAAYEDAEALRREAEDRENDGYELERELKKAQEELANIETAIEVVLNQIALEARGGVSDSTDINQLNIL